MTLVLERAALATSSVPASEGACLRQREPTWVGEEPSSAAGGGGAPAVRSQGHPGPLPRIGVQGVCGFDLIYSRRA